MTRGKFTPVVIQLVLIGSLFTNHVVYSEDLLLNLNPKKVVAVTSDKFLSLTIDPAVLLTGDVLTSSTELSTNMAKALAPGYVRLAGPRSNSYTFQRSLFPQSGFEDPDLTFSEAHWVLVQQWAQRAGLDVISSLNPKRIENEDQVSSWDPRNSLDLISFSDHMGYNISWQLGYECQTRCDVSGADLGKDVARLRNMLAAFPRYSNSIIAGPDFVSLRGRQQQQYIQDYLNAAGNALSVITWHPDFAGIALDSDGVALQVDTLATDKDLLYRSMGRSVAKKPLWIAESKPEECKRQFLGALVWARRLGSAAKLGVQVIMRQPDASNLFQPTPDYWVSLLHKMLVGREVLDAKLTSGNKTHVHFYCQCTKPSAKYDRGAITIFGINLTPGKVSVALKGLKIKAVHKYILMPGFDSDNRMFAETVLLNNEPLMLENGKNLPEINPSVGLMGKNVAVKLPSGGIGFWVIPGARVKLCMGHDDESSDKNLLLKKFAKKLEEPEATGDENLGHEFEDENPDLEAESAEDIKSLLKSKKKWRRNRHSDETDDEERKFKRIDTKKELEKLEKLLKRNNAEDKKPSHFKGRVGLSTVFESEENKEADTSEEDDGLVQFKSDKTNSGEDIRAKLEEYKNKLMEYENGRKKKNEKVQKQNSYTPSDIDTQKALEALALISKAENSMGEFGVLSRSDNVGLENRKSLDIGEEMMIEELESSDKTKRMIDPKSFGKLYQFLVNNGQDKRESKSRDKRDLEKLLGDDPLGLRKEGLFKKRLKNDEAKERRLERRMRKKEKEEIGLKKELQIPIAKYETRINADSNENNFFGFPQMKPLPNYPQGDVFLSEGTSEEEKSSDYDYVKDDNDENDEEDEKLQMQKKRRQGKGQKKTNKSEVVDQTWVEEPGAGQLPREFFERLNLPKVKIQTQWKDYGELYEPESLVQREFREEEKKILEEPESDIVIVKDRPDEKEDKRAKETAVKKLINYYDNSDVLKAEPVFDKSRSKEKKHGPKTQTLSKSPESLRKEAVEEKKRLLENQKKLEVSEEDSMEFFMAKSDEDYSEDDYVEKEIIQKKRPKRKIPNLDYEIFGKEMIREDAGNSKDCKCRVIRSSGKLECKNCRKSRRRRPQRDIIAVEDIPEVDTATESIVAHEEPETNQEEELPDLSDSSEAIVGLQQNIEAEDLTAEPVRSNLEEDDPKSLIEPMTELPVILEEKTEAEEPVGDVVGSVRQINEEDIGAEPEAVNLEEKVNAEKDKEEVQIPEATEAVKTEETVGSVRTEAVSESKLKNGLDLKSKSGRSRFALNTEALSTLIKESESKKADVIKAIETSAKLKSVENTKYAEYQRKRAEKLAGLKEKLKERKAKVLQQYRQELLDALSKCDDEVERNLKRREIIEDLSQLEEFEDFVDKDKLSYVMMNRPVNYEARNDEADEDVIENRRYYPKIEMIQPLRNQREQRIPAKEPRYFNLPKKTQFYPLSQESSESSSESSDPISTYYAIVESLENPKILHRKHFLELQREKESEEDEMPKKHVEQYQLQQPRHRVYPVDGPAFNHDKQFFRVYDDAVSPRYMPSKKYPSRESEPWGLQDIPWDPMTSEYQDDVLRRVQYPETRRFEDKQYAELEESVPLAGEEFSNLGLRRTRNLQIPDGPSFKIVRKQREVEDKRSNYVCLKEDSAEDFGDNENRLFKLVRNDDHFEAVPVSGLPEDFVARKQRKVDRRVLRQDEKVRNRRRKHGSDVFAGQEGRYYLRNGYKDETDYRVIGDELNRLESDPRLSPEEYELLMLIPVKKNRVKRRKRELDNTIDRAESFEDMNEVWGDIVDVKEWENKLNKYVEEKEKTVRDFEEAQANINTYLHLLGGLRDPLQLETFDRFILNLGSPDQEEVAVIAKSQDDLDRIHLGEYLKKEILKQAHGEEPKTQAPENSETTQSLFEEAMPKLEGVINEELEKVEKLTESFEDFINEFDQKFNVTSSETEIEVPAKKKKISYNIFHNALNNVKKFFDFLTGITRIFHRH